MKNTNGPRRGLVGNKGKNRHLKLESDPLIEAQLQREQRTNHISRKNDLSMELSKILKSSAKNDSHAEKFVSKISTKMINARKINNENIRNLKEGTGKETKTLLKKLTKSQKKGIKSLRKLYREESVGSVLLLNSMLDDYYQKRSNTFVNLKDHVKNAKQRELIKKKEDLDSLPHNQKSIKSMIQVATGNGMKMCTKLDGGHALVNLLKLLSDEQKKVLYLSDFKDHLVDLSNMKYGGYVVQHFFMCKDDVLFEEMFEEFKGHFSFMMTKLYGNRVLQSLYEMFSNDKKRLVEIDIYSQTFSEKVMSEFQHEVVEQESDKTRKNLVNKRQIFDTVLLKSLHETEAYRSSAEKTLKIILFKVFDKGFLDNLLVHRFLNIFFQFANTEEINNIIEEMIIKEVFPFILHTIDGCKACVAAIIYGTKKQKKSIIKMISKVVRRASKDSNGNIFVLSILENVDDTKNTSTLLKRLISTELAEPGPTNTNEVEKEYSFPVDEAEEPIEVFENHFVAKMMRYLLNIGDLSLIERQKVSLLRPSLRKIAFIKEVSEEMNSEEAIAYKKDLEKKKEELFKGSVSSSIWSMLKHNTKAFVLGKNSKTLLREVLRLENSSTLCDTSFEQRASIGDNLVELFVHELLEDKKNEMEVDEEENEIGMDEFRWLKNILLEDYQLEDRSKMMSVKFHEAIKGKVAHYLISNSFKGSSFLVQTLLSRTDLFGDEIMKELKKSLKKLKSEDNKGIQLIVKMIESGDITKNTPQNIKVKLEKCSVQFSV